MSYSYSYILIRESTNEAFYHN